MNVTVVIPTKDGRGVFDAIESVLAQDPHEVLVIDDRSEPQFSEELDAFCSGKDAVRYIHKADHPSYGDGLNGSRNLGVAEADGDAVALLDDDCIATDGWLDALAEQLETYDVVESHVQYVTDGKQCPMDRAIQNTGERHKFLGSGLAFRTAVGRDIGFEERFRVFRGDTTFGFKAMENGYTYTFAEDAVVEHHAGRFSPLQFVRERLRFVEDPLFVNMFRDSEHLEKEVDRIGNVLYPTELVYLGVLVAAALLPLRAATVPLLMGLAELVYLQRESGKRDLDACVGDLLLLFFLVPLALIAKRYAIWRGALRDNVFVV